VNGAKVAARAFVSIARRRSKKYGHPTEGGEACAREYLARLLSDYARGFESHRCKSQRVDHPDASAQQFSIPDIAHILIH
jgi:hypothetical protein